MTRRRTTTADSEAEQVERCRDAGLRGEVWQHRTFISAELAHDTAEVVISPLLNHPDAGRDVFSRGTNVEEEWEWQEPPEPEG